MDKVYVSTVISVNEFHFIGVFDNFLRFFTLKFSSSLASSKSSNVSSVFGENLPFETDMDSDWTDV